MQYIHSTLTDIGIKRPINQDSILALEADTEKGPVLLLSVCDGMGGMEHGEIASSIMVEELEDCFSSEFAGIILDDDLPAPLDNMIYYCLRDAMQRADERILKFSKEKKLQCGTTCVVLVLFGGDYYIMNVGDSRIYLHRNGSLFQLTHDQSLVQRLLDNGEIDEQIAKNHKQRGVLLQCIGMGKDFIPEFKAGKVLDRDIFFLCSDGLVHKIEPGEFESILTEEDPKSSAELKDLSSYLVEECKKRNESDNISVIMARAFL